MYTAPEQAEIGSGQGLQVWRQHWPEYLMEGAELGFFMISACLFGTLLEYPASPARQAITDPLLRRFLMGLAMALTAVCLIYSPWGQQSGAHLNPAVTWTFFRLGKVTFWDACFYTVGHFVGAIIGVFIASLVLGHPLIDPPVYYVVTSPGIGGAGIAFVAEMLIAFILMSVVLAVTNTPRLAPYTGWFAGALVALYITLEAPLSGMSLNPARSFGSAFHARQWAALWIYFAAPLCGMLLAAQVYAWRHGRHRVICAKLFHHNSKRCIFNHCGYQIDVMHHLPAVR